MNCKSFKEHIIFYLDGELDPIASAEFDQHRSACEACKRQFNQFASMYGLIEEDRITKSDPWIYGKVMTKVNEKAGEIKAEKIFRLRPVLLAASFTIPLLIGVLFGIDLSASSNIVISQDQQEETFATEYFDAGYDSDITDPVYTKINY
jgi:predicted anti-sigma-YlaC factor YlaD